MNTSKFLKVFGLLFVVIGAMVGISLCVISFQFRETGLIFMGLVFIVMFCGIGGFFAWYGNKLLHRDDEVLQKGTNYLAKVYRYDSDASMMMNGSPLLLLVVRYFENGEIREATVNTGIVNTAEFPLGSTVTIQVYEGRAALVPHSCTATRIEGEADLMNPDFDPASIYSSRGVACPNCGAPITVPLGMSRICPYCSTKVSLDPVGNIR